MSTTQGDESSNPEDTIAPDWALLITAAAAIIISFMGFFGNLLTIMALPYSNRLRHAATWLVVNLAVAEGIFCVTILPISAAHLFTLYSSRQPLFSDKGCSVFVFLRYVNVQAELLSIAAIAINRCVLISIPKKYPQLFTGPKTAGVIVGIWASSILIMLVPLFKIYGEFVYNNETNECDFSDVPEYGGEAPRKLYLTLGFLLPCVIIILSYSYIFYKALQSSAKMRGRCQTSLRSNASDASKPVKKAEGLNSRDIRIARTIGVIFLVFLICCIPVSVMHFLHHKVMMPTLLLLLHPVYWSQYCINIFVYVFMNKQYRDAYINYISRWFPDFREMSRRRFQWKEEATSDSIRRVSRAGTPSTAVRFQTRRKASTTSIIKGGPRATPPPNLNDTRL